MAVTYQPASESQVNRDLMRMIDEQYTRTPFYGSPRMTAHLRRRGYPVNHKRIEPLMQKMQLEAIYPKKRTSQPALGRKIYPYLLRGLKVTRPVQVWTADITYVRIAHGFVYLVAIIDWFSRYVVAWALSNTMETHFCLKALKEALGEDRPEIFNTDQGS